MPSPFPGMDPFLERQEWEGFHSRFNMVVGDLLSPRVEPRYVVRIERRVYVESPRDGDPRFVRPDMTLLWTAEQAGRAALAAAPAATLEPFECELPMPEERREAFPVIRSREDTEVVTVLEIRPKVGIGR